MAQTMGMTPEHEKRLIADFEWLHAHPELPYEEFETTAYLREELVRAGVPILPYPLATGLVAEIVGTKELTSSQAHGSAKEAKRPMIALRADIDALPVTEACTMPYRSQNEGKMHACGHDFHAAVLLCVARLLWEQRATFCGTVRCIFQPAEEASIGALKILETPAMEGVEAVFALHTSPLYPVGTIGLREGAVTASVNRFEITLHGKGVHAAYPESGVDTVVMGATLVNALQTVISRNVAPLSPALLSVTHFEAGNTWNVLPERAYLEGTVRTLSKADQELIPKRIEALAKGIAESYGGTAEFTWHMGPPATNNDPEWTRFAQATATACGCAVALDPPSMLGEDFSFFQELAPGVYIHAGIGLTEPNHNPKFCVDEESLAPSARYFATLARAALEKMMAE